MRGEDWARFNRRRRMNGSPPHARGRRAAVANGHGATGITPACAGKTDEIERRVERVKDHPRMREEYTGYPTFFSARTRITPACAGKTSNGKGYHDFL